MGGVEQRQAKLRIAGLALGPGRDRSTLRSVPSGRRRVRAHKVDGLSKPARRIRGGLLEPALGCQPRVVHRLGAVLAHHDRRRPVAGDLAHPLARFSPHCASSAPAPPVYGRARRVHPDPHGVLDERMREREAPRPVLLSLGAIPRPQPRARRAAAPRAARAPPSTDRGRSHARRPLRLSAVRASEPRRSTRRPITSRTLWGSPSWPGSPPGASARVHDRAGLDEVAKQLAGEERVAG